MDNNRVLSSYSPAVLSILHRSRNGKNEKPETTNSGIKMEIDDLKVSKAPMNPTGSSSSVMNTSGSKGNQDSTIDGYESKSGFIGETREFRAKMMENINIKMELERKINEQNEALKELDKERLNLREYYEHEKSVYDQEKMMVSKNIASAQEELKAVKDRNKEMENVREQYEDTVRRLDEKYKETKKDRQNLEKMLQGLSLDVSVANQQFSMADNNKRRCEDSLIVTQNLLSGLKADIDTFRTEVEDKIKQTKLAKTQGKNELIQMTDRQLETAREYQFKVLSFENDLKALVTEKEELDNEIIKIEEKISTLDISHQQNEIRLANKEMNKKLGRKNLINKNIELVNELNIVKYELESLENSIANRETAANNVRRNTLINKKVNEESLNLKIKEQDRKRKKNDECIAELTEKYKQLQKERDLIEKRKKEEGFDTESPSSSAPTTTTTAEDKNAPESYYTGNENENNISSKDTISKKKAQVVITPGYLNEEIEKETKNLNNIKNKMDEDRRTYLEAKDELQKKIDVSKAKLDEVEKMLEANKNDKNDIDFLKEEIEKLNNVNFALKNDINSLEIETSRMKSDHATSKDVVDKNNKIILSNEEKKIQTLKEKINNLKVIEAEEAQRQEGLKKQLADLQRHLDAEVEEKNKNNELKKEIESITNQIEEDRAREIEDREKELKANTRKLENLKEQKEILKNRKREMEDKSSEMDKEIAMKKLNIEDLKMNKENWSKDVITMRSHYESTKKLQELRAEQNSKSLAQLKTQKQLEITILKNDAASLDGNLREIKTQANNISIEIRSKEQQRDLLLEKNNARTAKYDEMKEKILANLEKNKEKLKDMKGRFNNLLEEHKKELDSMRAEAERLEKENDANIDAYATDIVKKNDEARAEMKKKVITLNYEIEELGHQIASNKENYYTDITNLKIEICNSEQLVEKGKNEKSRLEGELAKAENTFNSISTSNNQRLDIARRESLEAEKRLEELEGTREALSQEIENKNKEINELKGTVSSYKGILAEMDQDLEKSKMEYIRATEENDSIVMNLRTRLSMAKTRKNEVEKEREELLKEEAKIDALISQTKTIVQDTEKEGSRYTSQLQGEEKQRYPLTLSSGSSPYNVEDINGSSRPDIYDQELKPPSEEVIPELQQKIRETEKEIEDIREDFRTNCIDLENKITEVEGEIEKNLDDKDTKVEELKNREGEIKLLEDKIENEEDETEEIKENIQEIEEGIEEKNKKMNEYEEKIKKLKVKTDEVDKLGEIIAKIQRLIGDVDSGLVRDVENEADEIKDLEERLRESETTVDNIIEADKGKSIGMSDEFTKTGEIVNSHINAVIDKLDSIDKLQFECDSLLMKMESIITKVTSFGRYSSSSTTQEVMRTFSSNMISLFRTVSSHVGERKRLLDELAKSVSKCQHNLTNVVSYCAATRDDIIRVAARRLNLLSSERDSASDYCDVAGKGSGLLSTFIQVSRCQNRCLKTLLECVEGFSDVNAPEDISIKKKELEKLSGDVERLEKLVPQRSAAPALGVGAE